MSRSISQHIKKGLLLVPRLFGAIRLRFTENLPPWNETELIGRFLRKDHLNQRLARSGIAHDHFRRIIFREIRPQFLQSITCESRANIEAKQTGRYIGRYGRCCLCCHNWRAIADCAALMQKPAQITRLLQIEAWMQLPCCRPVLHPKLHQKSPRSLLSMAKRILPGL